MKEIIQIFDMDNETLYPVITFTDFDKSGKLKITIKAPNREFADLAFEKLEGAKKFHCKYVNGAYYYTLA